MLRLLRSDYWIFGPVQDCALVLGTPLLILSAFGIAHWAGWMEQLVAFGLVLAVAHYLPGILRAYGDKALFRRFRWRLVVVPILLLTVTTTFAYWDLHIVLLLSMLWGAWHWMMQVYGFARIYEAKGTPITPSWLDQALCIAWFGMCVFVLNNGLLNIHREVL